MVCRIFLAGRIMKLWKRAKWAVPFCLFPVGVLASDQVSTWNGGTGNWSIASSWTTSPTDGLVPNNGNGGFTFDAIVGSGTVNLDLDVTLNGLTITGGSTIEGSGNLSVLQNVDWQYGFLNGSGTATFQGTTTFSGSVGADRTINNFGTFTGAGGFDGAGILNNQSGGVLSFHSGNVMYFDGTGELNNLLGGVITVNNAMVNVNRAFHNAGQVNVQAGGFTIGGGGTNTGTISVTAGQTLFFYGNASFSNQGTITGAGDVTIGTNSGEVIIESGSTFNPTGVVRLQGGGTTTFNTAATIQQLQVASHLGGTGDITVANTFGWENGTISSVVNLHGTSQLSGGTLNGTINNFGTASTVDGGGFQGEGGGVWNNKAGSSFTIVNETQNGGIGGVGTFNNEAGAVLNKTGANAAATAWVLNNAGQFNLQQGDFNLDWKAVNSGTINIASGAHLNVITNEGTNAFVSTGTITGPGSIYFAPSDLATIEAGSTFTVTGLVTVRGSVEFNNVVSIPQLLLNTGTLRQNNVMTVTNHADLSGWIDGTGTLNIANTAFQEGGLFIQNGTVNVQNSMTIAPNFFLDVGTAARFNNHGVVELRGVGALTVSGTLENKLGATIIKRDADFVQVYDSTGGPSLFDNGGTFRAEAGLTRFSNNLNVLNQPTGLIHAQGGDIEFYGTTPLDNRGELRAEPGKSILVASPLAQYDNFSLTGGTYRLNGSGVINISGVPRIERLEGAAVILDGASPSQFNGIDELWNNNGRFELRGGSNFAYTSPNPSFINDGTLHVGAGSTFSIADPTNFNITQRGHMEGAGTITGPQLIQNGTFAGVGGTLNLDYTSGSGPTPIIMNGSNNRITGGTVQFKGLHLRGTLTVDAGATLRSDTGGLGLPNEEGSSSTLIIHGTADSFINVNQGNIGGTGNITGHVSVYGSGGGPSSLYLHSTGTLTLHQALNIRDAETVATIAEGTIAVLGPTNIENSGKLKIDAGATLAGPGPINLINGTIENLGTIAKTVNVTGNFIASGTINTVHMRGGTVTGNAGFGLVDCFEDSAIGNGTYTINDMNALAGTLTISNGANVNVPNTVFVGSSIDVNGVVTGDKIRTAEVGVLGIGTGGFAQFREWRIEGDVFIASGGRGKSTLPATVVGKVNVGGVFEGDIVTVPDANHPGVVSGSGRIEGSAQVGTLGGIDVGSSPGTLTITNGVTLLQHSFLNMEVGHSLTDLLRITGGTFSVPDGNIHVHITPLDAMNVGDVFTLIDWTGATASNVTVGDFLLGSNSTVDGTFSITSSQLLFTISSVPEPTTWALMGLGLAGSGLVYWRKRHQWKALQDQALQLPW